VAGGGRGALRGSGSYKRKEGEAFRFALFRPSKPRRFAYAAAHLRAPHHLSQRLGDALQCDPESNFRDTSLILGTGLNCGLFSVNGAMIEVQNLTKRYGAFRAVDRISFSVSKGEIFGFLGPNGAGKTTTIKMLTTMLKPTEGSVRVGGFDPVRDQGAVRRTIGIVFQDPSLDEALTAFENMELHAVLYRVDPRERGGRIEKLLRFVELWDRRTDLVKRFSGGMKRRLEIARALLHEPKVMFLDEPTLGLDPQTRNHIWRYIENLSRERGVTVFFTTHYMEEADRVAD
jgi:ABC-2 type transport system ATP-binding protein